MKVKFLAFIYDGDTEMGDVAVYEDGSATVMNYLSGLQQWFDGSGNGQADALRYIKARMTPHPVFK